MAWAAGAGAVVTPVPTIYWEGIGLPDPPPINVPWARVAVKHTPKTKSFLAGALGTKRFEFIGVVLVNIFVPLTHTNVVNTAVSLGDVGVSAFAGKATSNAVWFRNPSVQEVGVSDSYYQVNISAEFIYDNFI